jgi:hypothetical protein
LTIQKNDLYKSGIILPEDAPARFMTGRHYGGGREIRKTKGQSDLSPRHHRLAAELNGEQNEELLKKYLKNNFKLGMCADYAIHDINNKPHAHHANGTMRKCENGGFSKKGARVERSKIGGSMA